MKIGIFGGTFDPVHVGHLELGKQALRELNLDKLIVVPAKLQPFKLDAPVTSGEHRTAMLKLAFQDVPSIEISDFELKREEVSYTIYTLNAFHDAYPEAELWFLLGTDAMLKIHLWKNAEELLTKFNIAVGLRPGYKETELMDQILQLEAAFNTNIRLLTNKKLNISSTEIKERIHLGKTIEKLVPAAIERYIHNNALYT